MAIKNFSFPLFFFLISVVSHLPGVASPASGVDGFQRISNAVDVPNGGSWHMLHRSIGISAMHMQLLPGGKLIVSDRTGAGLSKISLPGGRCLKKDCTAHSVLFDVADSTFRPLTLLTDNLGSAGALLPNGSLLQTGGFDDGELAVRAFDPLSSPTAAGADWVEQHSNPLAAGRSYASDQILPDGRVLVLGGLRQLSYEFFPRQENSSAVHFDFLGGKSDRESMGEESLLYPFLHLLPDGTLFVFANNHVAILDVSLRRVIRRLPSVPDGFRRSYPSSGSSVLLRLSLPNPDPEILICGGAALGADEAAVNGTFLTSADTCGLIALQRDDPSWVIQEMPLPRVMGDMVLLPTGDVLIINGASAGTAGAEMARKPVLNPILYRPGLPTVSRFVVMNHSPIPRLYGSTAALDTYGRVLVGGSNPHDGYVFSDVTFPTDLSIEAFHPPYMDALFSALRPRIIGGGGGLVAVVMPRFDYDERVTLPFEVGMFRDPQAVEVVLVAPTFVTHSVGMNQRAVALQVERVESSSPPLNYDVEVRVPPSPAIAPPGYYMLFVVHAGVPSEAVWVRIGLH
ncbi:hypothetical protein HPP92_011969 [Vanilla planifolia]|uniref:Galactose oxidase n=1 Tax=Vanilla planifolia TaxID=51239 RepID=A0A835R1N4_VANPL|nr:hypothetical protein HPP92_011969 [Vanilla planifolia]